MAKNSQEYQREYMRKNGRKYHLKKYDLTKESYEILLEQQGYSCAICKVHISEISKRLSIDHDHETGAVRGLLCSKCNFGLGNFNDDKSILCAALDYLNGSEYGSNEEEIINKLTEPKKI